MALHYMQHGSTLAKPRVFAVTDDVVATPAVKRQSIVFAEICSSADFLDELETLPKQQGFQAGSSFFNEVDVPAISQMKPLHEGALATVIQIWEGVILSVDFERGIMTVKLTDRGGLIGDHTADIELQWVSNQDRDLLRPGAVFYWTMFKETKRGSVSNSQEIRFRRLPSWTKRQLAIMHEDALELSTKFSTTTRIAD